MSVAEAGLGKTKECADALDKKMAHSQELNGVMGGYSSSDQVTRDGPLGSREKVSGASWWAYRPLVASRDIGKREARERCAGR